MSNEQLPQAREESLDPHLIDAYLNAEYWVFEATAAFLLRVGRYSEDLLSLHSDCGAACSAFLTAYNPGSLVRSDAWNRTAQERLEADLRREGFALRRGVAKDPSGVWPDERSVLVLGIPRDAAKFVGRTYGQKAIVWSGLDAVPSLVTVG